MTMKTLFLNPTSFDGFDGGAGSRYQARREIRSFWYPTWLAQPAALLPESKLIDAPARAPSILPRRPAVGDRHCVWAALMPKKLWSQNPGSAFALIFS